MNNRVNAALQIYKKHGLSTSAAYLYHRIVQKLHGGKFRYRKVYLYILDSPRPNERAIKAAEHHTFKFASMDDLTSLQQQPEFEINEPDIKAMKHGDRCLLQLDGDTLVGYAWLAASSLVKIEWGFHFNMSDDTVYNYKGYTAPQYRGKGFQPLRHLKLLELVKTEGKKQLLGYVDQMNINSQKGVKKSGYFKIGTLKSIRTETHINHSLDVPRKFWSDQIRL